VKWIISRIQSRLGRAYPPVVVPVGMLSFDMPRLPVDQERKQQRLWLMGPSYANKFRF